ncbi:hypothetical protein SMD44_07351 [Streptomyces alboflavus]|uniref:Uncharacterized protein n=1 Tax=Streptomyces alboflavus TaxID=67267 RepID=A0A1Z1WNA5_9ACTN|nr:hypothetical protein SMD44_07351 [Streptomyces alboflavus]
MECTCEGECVISPTEAAMADATGMDPLFIHVFMDTWEAHAMRVIEERF